MTTILPLKEDLTRVAVIFGDSGQGCACEISVSRNVDQISAVSSRLR